MQFLQSSRTLTALRVNRDPRTSRSFLRGIRSSRNWSGHLPRIVQDQLQLFGYASSGPTSSALALQQTFFQHCTAPIPEHLCADFSGMPGRVVLINWRADVYFLEVWDSSMPVCRSDPSLPGHLKDGREPQDVLYFQGLEHLGPNFVHTSGFSHC